MIFSPQIYWLFKILRRADMSIILILTESAYGVLVIWYNKQRARLLKFARDDLRYVGTSRKF
jgi:hypothetical protein